MSEIVGVDLTPNGKQWYSKRLCLCRWWETSAITRRQLFTTF